MTPLRIAFCALVSATSCAACTPALTAEEVENKLTLATASALNADPAAVRILHPQQMPTRWVWQAQSGGKAFECDADRSFALPDCRSLS
jgi:hypothetical protein